MTHLYPTLVQGCEKQGLSVAVELPELPPEVLGVPDQQLLFLAVGTVGLWGLLTLWGAVERVDTLLQGASFDFSPAIVLQL